MAMSTSPVGWDKEDLRAQVELWKANARTPIITYCINYQAEVVAKAGSDGEVGDDDGLPNESSVSLRRTRPCRQHAQPGR
jgi:hypothetical protein